MSERLTLRFGENEFEMQPDNTTLFTFLGRSAIRGVEMDHDRFNHIFFVTGDETDDTVAGSYMFLTEENQDTFHQLTSHMAEHRYPMVINRRDVPDCDVDAYFRHLDQKAAASTDDLGDFIPEGWL